jgi:hypothetical protein
MDKYDPIKDRRKAREFALKVYTPMRFSRHYALTNEATMMLTVLAAAMAQYRKSFDVKDDDLYDEEAFKKLINQLAGLVATCYNNAPPTRSHCRNRGCTPSLANRFHRQNRPMNAQC